jgi:hypothetical protein
MMVIGSFTSYTKTKSVVESAVWCLLTLDDGAIFLTGSKYLNTVQGQNCSFLISNNNNNKHWWKWNKASNRTMNKINEQLIRNLNKNNKYKHWLTGTDILYYQLNHECLFIATSLNVTVLVLLRVKTKTVSREQSGNYGYLLGSSRDNSHQAKGTIGIESTQIRWFLQWSSGGGWYGRAVLSGGQESQN